MSDSGAPVTASFTATTSPAIGAYTSLAAFTDSTTAQASPAKARPWNNLGFAYARICRDEDARTAFEQAAELDPVDIRPRVNLKLLGLDRLVPEERQHCRESSANR